MFESLKKLRDRRHRRASRKSRKTPSAKLRVERLEDRRMFAVAMGPIEPLSLWGITLDASAGTINIAGTTRSDTATVSNYAGGYRVTLNSTTRNISSADASRYSQISFSGGLGNDSFTNSTSLASSATGGAGNDTLRGGSGADTFSGGDGDDTLTGNGGNDTLAGDDGADTIYGGDGADVIDAGDDDDAVQGGEGNDTIDGGAGDDVLEGKAGDDTVRGGDGNDELIGQEGDDSLSGQAGDDTLCGSDGDDTLDGGDGTDSVEGGSGDDTLRGGAGSDALDGGDGDDAISGEDGSDTLYGSAGADELEGGDGADELHGGDGNDTLSGDAGNDDLYGDAGADVLHGGHGDDELYGGEGGDDLYGDVGDDVLMGMDGDDGLFGGFGDDELWGGDNEDRFLVRDGIDEDQDKTSSDALLTFRDRDASWTDAEIEAIDEALATLHRFTGDKTLLERESGNDLTFDREIVHPDTTATSAVLAVNNNSGEITFYDDAFSSVVPVVQIVFHEFGHNWDDEGDVWSEFKDASGWDAIGVWESRESGQSLSDDGEWYYDTGTAFVEDYGETNPYEDFACVFALFFMHQHGEDYRADGSFESTSDLIASISEAGTDKWDIVSDYLATL
jgi:Ca2+-binding RTX toxin-like protein